MGQKGHSSVACVMQDGVNISILYVLKGLIPVVKWTYNISSMKCLPQIFVHIGVPMLL